MRALRIPPNAVSIVELYLGIAGLAASLMTYGKGLLGWLSAFPKRGVKAQRKSERWSRLRSQVGSRHAAGRQRGAAAEPARFPAGHIGVRHAQPALAACRTRAPFLKPIT